MVHVISKCVFVVQLDSSAVFFPPCFFHEPPKNPWKNRRFRPPFEIRLLLYLKKTLQKCRFWWQKWYTYMDGWFRLLVGVFHLKCEHIPLKFSFPPEKSYGPPRGPLSSVVTGSVLVWQGEDTATLEGDLPDLEIVYSSQLDCRRCVTWRVVSVRLETSWQ